MRTNAIEAEHLPVVRARACKAGPEPQGTKGISGGGMLRVEPTGPGATVTLRVPAVRAGQYRLAVWRVSEFAQHYKFELSETPLPAPARSWSCGVAGGWSSTGASGSG